LVQEPPPNVKYQIHTRTIEKSDAPVELRIIGERGETGWLTLDEPDRDDFEAGASDRFAKQARDVGTVTGGVVRLNAEGSGRWVFGYVHVANIAQMGPGRPVITREMDVALALGCPPGGPTGCSPLTVSGWDELPLQPTRGKEIRRLLLDHLGDRLGPGGRVMHTQASWNPQGQPDPNRWSSLIQLNEWSAHHYLDLKDGLKLIEGADVKRFTQGTYAMDPAAALVRALIVEHDTHDRSQVGPFAVGTMHGHWETSPSGLSGEVANWMVTGDQNLYFIDPQTHTVIDAQSAAGKAIRNIEGMRL
jgi:hypothetical protein